MFKITILNPLKFGRVADFCQSVMILFHNQLNERSLMSVDTNFTVACLFFEICGATETFETECEYEVFGDDWTCAECYDQSEMLMYGWEG